MRLAALANGTEDAFEPTLSEAIATYESRDAERVANGVARSTPRACDGHRQPSDSVPLVRRDVSDETSGHRHGALTGHGRGVHPKPKGIVAVLFPVLRPMIRRGMAKQHQNLKALCEAQGRSPDE